MNITALKTREHSRLCRAFIRARHFMSNAYMPHVDVGEGEKKRRIYLYKMPMPWLGL